MNRHSLTYIDMHPQPVDQPEPHPALIWLSGAAVALAVWGVTYLAFSL